MNTQSVDPQWKRIAEKIKSRPGLKTIYLLGGCDTGKSTLAHFLVQSLCQEAPVAYLDCDPGQSVLGTPATIGLGLYRQSSGGNAFAIQTPLAKYLRFVGAHTPVGHMLENVTCIKKLQEKALQGGAAKVIIDSCGYIQDAVARSFQFHSLDITSPDLIIEICREHSMQSLLQNFAGTAEIQRLGVLPAVREKPPDARKAYREEKFRKYFANHQQVVVSYANLGLHGRIPDFRSHDSYNGRLIALCNRNHFVLVLALITDVNMPTRQLTLLAPPFPADRVAALHFGSLYCAPGGEHRSK